MIATIQQRLRKQHSSALHVTPYDDDEIYWNIYRSAVQEYTDTALQKMARNGSRSNHVGDDDVGNSKMAHMHTLLTEVTKNQASEMLLLHKQLLEERETHCALMKRQKDQITELETSINKEIAARSLAEEAGKSLSSELHRCRQELQKAHELYKNKLTEMEQYKTLVESEMDGLEQERDDAIQQIMELEKNLEKLTVAVDSSSRENSIAATTELENELAETRLKLALAQSERDEMELTTVGLDVHETLHNKSKSHLSKGDNFCSPSSSGSENSSIRNGESWFRVDSMVE